MLKNWKKKLIASLLIFTLTFSNFAIVGKTYAAYIADSIFGNKQDDSGDTGSSNVEFDAYFKTGQDSKTSKTVKADVKSSDLSIGVSVKVKNSGYLKDAKILFGNGKELNFKVNSEVQVPVQTNDLTTIENEVVYEEKTVGTTNENVFLEEIVNSNIEPSYQEESIEENIALQEETVSTTNSNVFNQELTTGNSSVNQEQEETNVVTSLDSVQEEPIVNTVQNEQIAEEVVEENYETVNLVENNEQVQVFENNELYLVQLNADDKMEIEFPISYEYKKFVQEEMISKTNQIKFEGIYINDNAKEVAVSKIVDLKLSWEDEREIKTSSEITKYIGFNQNGINGIILQTSVEVDSSSQDVTLPIKDSNVKINVPVIDGQRPETINVVAKSLAGTTGKENDSVVFGDENWSYDSESNQLTIKVENKPELVSTQNENDILIDETAPMKEMYYSEAGVDNYLITYTYKNVAAKQGDTAIAADAKNIVILDSIENYQHGLNASAQSDVSEWHGVLTGFEFSSLESNGVDVRVYLTTQDKNRLNFDTLYGKEHSILEADLAGETNGVEWVLWDASNVDLDKVTAFAVDLRKKKDGTDYVLGYNQSFNFIIHMKAPSLKVFNDDEEQQGFVDDNGKIRYDVDHDPETNNSIFRSYDSIFDNMYTFGENSEIEIDQSESHTEELIVKQKLTDEDGIVKNINTTSISYDNLQNVSYKSTVFNEETEEYEVQDVIKWKKGSNAPFTVHTGDKITYIGNDGTEQTLTIGITDEIDWISSAPEYGFYAHTVVTYHAVGNMKIAKANEEDVAQLIPDIPFHIHGTSWYDTENAFDMDIITNDEGYLVVENLPRGEYTLQEQAGNADWVLDATIHSVVVDAYGNTFLDGELLVNDIGTFKASNTNYREYNGKIWITIDDVEYPVSDEAIFFNRPRKHGVLNLRKVDEFHHDKQLYGAEFVLKSDVLTFYGNEITEYATSDMNGLAVFDDVEQGKYTLTETVFPDGYVPISKTYQVICDENGNVSVTGQSYDDSGAYVIENTPYTELKLRKLDNVNQSEMVEGAEFTLTLVKADIKGNADISKLTEWTDGLQVKNTSSNGIIVFSQLFDGEYTLTETKAPSDGKHMIDEEHPPTYQLIVKDNQITKFALISGTDAFEPVFHHSKLTGDEWVIYNNRAYENEAIVNKKWIGDPMKSGFPGIHMIHNESINKTKTATINKEIFQDYFLTNH